MGHDVELLIKCIVANATRIACANGNKEIVGALIEAGHDVNFAMRYSPLGHVKNGVEDGWHEHCKWEMRRQLNF